jgi:hypothetical protein
MAESVVTLWSKTADFSAAVPAFPGVFDKALYDSKVSTSDIADLYGTNGTYIEFDSGDSTALTSSGGFILTVDDTNLAVGMYARLENVSVSNNPGYYRIDALLGGGVELNGTSLDGVNLSASDTVSFYIGGVSDACDDGGKLQTELNLIGPRCGAAPANSNNNLDILAHASTDVGSTVQLDFDAISGSTTTDVVFAAVNSSFVEDGTYLKIVLTAGGATNGVIQIVSDFITIRNVKCIVSPAGVQPTQCIYTTTAAASITFYNCQGVGGNAYVFNLRGNVIKCVKCVAVGPNRAFRSTNPNSSYSACIALYGDYGWEVGSGGSCIVGCVAIRSSIASFLVGNMATISKTVMFECVDGIYISQAQYKPIVVNDCSITCTDDAFTGAADTKYQSYNNHTDVGGSVIDGNSSFTTEIDPITGDPKFNKIVEVTDLAYNYATSPVTVTSATGGFESWMAGHDLLIASAGTGTKKFIPGAYEIASVTDTNTVVLTENPTFYTAAGTITAGDAGFYDFRLQTDSPLRDAGSGAFSNIGVYSDTDTPAINNILPPDTFNDVVGTGSGGAGGGVMPLTGLLS